MDIKNVCDLKKLISLCRKTGVESFKADGIEFKLSQNLPPKKPSKKEILAATKILNENPISEADLMFWSSAGIPEVANG